MDIGAFALDFIANYGLIAIFVLLVLDGALLLPVFPGELVLVIAVTTYVHDMSSLIFIIGLTSAAGLVGSLILYGITRGGGRRLVEKFPNFFMMPRKRRERLEKVFANPWGQTLVLFMRLVPLTRVLVSIPAGLARMPPIRFIVLSTIGLIGYHAAFLWFTYEARRPGSSLEAQTAAIQATYAGPAVEFVQANSILAGLVVVCIGAILSVKSSMAIYKDPEESTGSLIGNLASAILLLGGIALAVMTYTDPETVYTSARIGGLDVHVLAADLGIDPLVLLAAIAATSIFLGAMVRHLQGRASRRKRHFKKAKKAHERWEREEAIRAALIQKEHHQFINNAVVDEARPADSEFEWRRGDPVDHDDPRKRSGLEPTEYRRREG